MPHKPRRNSEPQKVSPKRLPPPTGFQDVVLGVSVQIARKLLFWPARKKAFLHFVIVFLVSSWVAVFPMDDDVYWAKKSNIFNQYGTKIGWFWTLVTVGPFIWATTYITTKSTSKAGVNLLRLVAATFVWYIVTSLLIHIEQITGQCTSSNDELRKATRGLPRRQCAVAGGKWSPGFDISGHCFLLIFNILIMTEEAISFQHWPTQPETPTGARASNEEYNEFIEASQGVQGLFVLLAIFHLFWDSQLIITCAYYHRLPDKILGALAGIAGWAVLYRGVFPLFPVPGMPTLRERKTRKTI